LTTCPVLSLEESLVLALQLLFQHDSSHWFSSIEMALSGLHVRRVNARVVRELARLRDANVERLPRTTRIAGAVLFKDRPPLMRQRNQSRSSAAKHVWSGAYKAKIPQPFEIARGPRRCPWVRLAQVTRRNHSERADCREDADIIARQSILSVIGAYPFSGRPARQVEIAREYVSWVVGNRDGIHVSTSSNSAPARLRPVALE
jgi:hypothetical protein